MWNSTTEGPDQAVVHIGIGLNILDGTLTVPHNVRGVVLFADTGGSSRLNPRNAYISGALHQAGLATLLIDLLTPAEEAVDQRTNEVRLDTEMLAERLTIATDWLGDDPRTIGLPIGYFATDTGASAALIAAARRPDMVQAIVSRGGRPDLGVWAAHDVRMPTLLIVGGSDPELLGLNQMAYDVLPGIKHLEIIPSASNYFSESGAIQQVVSLSRNWFTAYLRLAEREAGA